MSGKSKTGWRASTGLGRKIKKQSKNILTITAVPMKAVPIHASSSTTINCDPNRLQENDKKKKADDDIDELAILKRLKIELTPEATTTNENDVFSSPSEPMELGTQPKYVTQNEINVDKSAQELMDTLTQPKASTLQLHENSNKNFLGVKDFITTFDYQQPDVVPLTVKDPTDSIIKNFSFRRLSDEAYGMMKGEIGFYIMSPRTVIILKGQSGLVKSDLQISLPENMLATVYFKSPLDPPGFVGEQALRFHSGYRENVAFTIHNKGENDIWISRGQVIAQLIFTKVVMPDFIEQL